MMSALAQPFVSLKSWLMREDELATPSPVADENHFTTRQDYNRFSDLMRGRRQHRGDWLRHRNEPADRRYRRHGAPDSGNLPGHASRSRGAGSVVGKPGH